jgi:hypothetical protein
MTIIEFCKKYHFELLLAGSVIIILLMYIFRKNNKKGTWAKSYFMLPKKYQKYQQKQEGSFKSKGEVECKRVVEKLFSKGFVKVRPDILRNPVTGGIKNLELDCYNDEMKLAIEYNGEQHYKYIPYFHKNNEAFLNQKYRDFMKQTLCEKHGITLIEVPYTVSIQDIEKYLIGELKQKGYLR